MDSATASAFNALRTRRQWLVFACLAITATIAAHLLDATAWQQWRDPRIHEKEIGRLLRVVGYVPTWLIVAIALWAHDRGRHDGGHHDGGHHDGGRENRHGVSWGWRGGLVLLAPIAGGAAAELLKMLVRRLRPSADVFGYAWRPFSEDLFSTRGLGMPSSHTLAAFAGAAALSRVFPRSWALWYLLAAGCAATRVLALGHFLSDTVVAALLGYMIGVLLSRSGGFGRAVMASATDGPAAVRA